VVWSIDDESGSEIIFAQSNFDSDVHGDGDEDGFSGYQGDCDDTDPAVNPDAVGLW
jgi:hypothetical protein